MKKNKLKLKKCGFTLVELLIVISIIAILVAITSSSFLNSQKRSRDSLRKTELKELSDALNMYYADNGVFPSATGTGSTAINSLISSGGEFADNSNSNNKIVYMKKVPTESTGGVEQILYELSSTFKSFRLYTNLENEKDSDCIKDIEGNNLTSLNGYSIPDDGKSCIYVITSSNASVNSLP